MALLEFRSKASGGFFLMPETFKEVCKVLSRPYSESGSWPVEDLEGILQILEAEVSREKIARKRIEETIRQESLAGRDYASFDKQEEQRRQFENQVSFGMRTFPLREMLSAAIKKGVPVMWGVP